MCQRAFVEGRIECSSYERQDGETVYTTDIVVHELIMLGTTGTNAGDDEFVTGPVSALNGAGSTSSWSTCAAHGSSWT